MANPTHLSVYFMRTIRVRKEHLLGEQVDGRELMTIVHRGETRKVQFVPAQHLMVEESVLQDTAINRERIDADKAEVRALADAERDAQKTLKKAA